MKPPTVEEMKKYTAENKPLLTLQVWTLPGDMAGQVGVIGTYEWTDSRGIRFMPVEVVAAPRPELPTAEEVLAALGYTAAVTQELSGMLELALGGTAEEAN